MTTKIIDGLLLPQDDFAFSNFASVYGQLDKWGEEEFNIVYEHLLNKRTCIDIGAHVGLTSLRYSKHFENVHSFEPFHHLLLKENVKQCTNVNVYPYAVDDKEGDTTFYIHPTNSGSGFTAGEGTATLKKNRYGAGMRFETIEPVTVQTKTIDSYNFADVDFVKIDVEGNNLPVLNGMINTLRKYKPVLQIEDSLELETNVGVLNILNELGYSQFASHGKPIDRFYK